MSKSMFLIVIASGKIFLITYSMKEMHEGNNMQLHICRNVKVILRCSQITDRVNVMNPKYYITMK